MFIVSNLSSEDVMFEMHYTVIPQQENLTSTPNRYSGQRENHSGLVWYLDNDNDRNYPEREVHTMNIMFDGPGSSPTPPPYLLKFPEIRIFSSMVISFI